MKKYKYIPLVLAILAPSIILRALAMDILLPSVPTITEYFATTAGTAQWILSIYFLGAGFGQLFVGPLADEYGRRRVLIISALVVVLASIACTQITNIYVMMLVRFIQGLGACGTTVATMAILRDMYNDQQLPKVYSYYNGIVALAPLFAPLIGGLLLIHTGSWRAPFYFVTAFAMLAVAINYFYIEETNPKFTAGTTFVNVPIIKSYGKLIRDREFLGYCCFNVMGMSSMFLFFSMSSLLLMKLLGVNPKMFGCCFFAISAMYLVGNIVSPIIQQKFKPNGTIFLGSTFMLLGGTFMYIGHMLNELSLFNLLIPNGLSTFGVGLLFGPAAAGAVKHYKNIAGIASAAYGAIFIGASAILVGLIMQVEIVDASVLAMSLATMGLVNILVIHQIIRHSKKSA